MLVGDHVQLRATIGKHASALDFDVSLMERLWANSGDESIGRVMLDTQYRMHPDLCKFPSSEFYEEQLLTADVCFDIPLPMSKFPWPELDLENNAGFRQQGRRSVFIQCDGPEDYGSKSKANQTQAKLCKEILVLLTTAPGDFPRSGGSPDRSTTPPPSIAVLTPYSRQADLVRQLCGGVTVSTIDGFQGQEADIVIFTTLRCNLHRDIGFLKDMRRMNVALTRARAGMIIIGDSLTLTQNQDEEACRAWGRLVKTCAKVKMPTI